MNLRIEDCSLKFLSRFKMSTPAEAREYQATFETWHRVWTETFKELGVEKKVHSDGFTRQDDIMAIFHGPICFAMLCFRRLDFSKFDYATDSYFEVWQPEDMKKLLRFGPKIMTSCYLTVDHRYRSRITGVSFRNVLMDMMAKRIFDTDCDALAGITRRDKNVHATAYAQGAQMIRENMAYNTDADRVDLLVWPKIYLKPLPDPITRKWSDTLYPAKEGKILHAA